MPKIFTSKTQKTGEIGENIAVKFLMKQDFSILERNYTKKWGEIDIIAEKYGKIHFIEVKSVSIPSFLSLDSEIQKKLRPEENMHQSKIRKFTRVIQTYLQEKGIGTTDWTAALIAIRVDVAKKRAKVRFIEDLVLQ